MSDPSPTRRQIRARRGAQVLGALAAGLGSAVLFGHIVGHDAPLLGGAGPPMVGNTALMAILGGCSLALQGARERTRARTSFARLLGAVVVGVSAVTLGEYAVGYDGSWFDLGLLPDQWVPETARWPGRSAPHTAVSFLSMGLALLVLDRGGTSGVRPAEVLALLGLAPPFVGLLGHVFDVEVLYGVPGFQTYTGMSLFTAATLLFVGAGALLARPEVGLTAVVTSDGPGGVAARRMLVGMATLAPLAVLAIASAQAGIFTVPVATSLVAAMWVASMLGFVLTTSVRLERTAEAAREGEQVRARMAALVASSSDAILATSPDGVIVDWNPAAEQVYGYAASEVVGRPLVTLFPEPDRERSRSVLERLRSGERVPEFEATRVRKDGTLVPVSITAAPILGPAGEVVGISSISRDISARRALEAARDTAEQERLAALERERAAREELDRVLRAGCAVADAFPDLPQGNLQHVLTVIGLQAQALTDAAMVAVGVDGDAERPFAHWVASGVDSSVARAIGRTPRARGVLGASAVRGEVVRVRDVHDHPAYEGLPEHHPELTSVLAAPVLFRGRPVGNIYLGNKRGAAEFSEADERVVLMLAARAGAAIETARLYERENLERLWLQAVFDQMPEGIVIFDREGRVSHANHTARAQVPGDAPPIFRSALGGPLPEDQQPVQRVLARGETLVGLSLGLVGPDGRLIPVLVSATPVRTARGLEGSVLVYQDVTALREMERLREEWSTVVAHDLRQPLSVISTGAELLRRYGGGRLTEPEARTLQRMADAARQLSRMVGDLMDASRIEARRLTLDRRELDLAPLVTECVERMRVQQPGGPLVLHAEGGLRVSADADRIQQILDNLLSNAVKYGSPGEPITVTLRRRDEETLQLTVSNRGPGIAREELDALFTRFSRTRSARAGAAPGSGLGLYITRGLVDAHGGSVWAESEPGATTRFHVVLPLAVAAERTPATRSPASEAERDRSAGVGRERSEGS